MSTKITVTTKCGKIRGITEQSKFSGVSYIAFYGIPYGKPPIKTLRFQDPIQAAPWKGVLDATIPKGGCVHFSILKGMMKGSEDCLYVNVYTCSLPSQNEQPKPVVVYFHAGGFIWGSPDPEDLGSPDFIMHNDIVYVTVCYRMHILACFIDLKTFPGFLNLNLETCSGNQAIKDMILALKWINENIQNFNGDPENITAMSASSSSSLIHVLMMTQAGKGLFHKVLLTGIHCTNPLIYVPENHEEIAFKYATSLGFRGAKDSKQLLLYLKKLPVETIMTRMHTRFHHSITDKEILNIFPTAPFIPTYDQGENAIIPKHLKYYIPTMERVPLMFGICRREAVMAYFDLEFKKSEECFKSSLRQNCYGWAYHLNDENIDEIFTQVDSFYYRNERCTSMTTKIDILTDAGLSDVYPTFIDVVAADLPSSVFLYKFDFEGELSFLRHVYKTDDLKVNQERIKGTYHFDDMMYWSRVIEPTTETSMNMIRTFTKLICNFARYGNPNTEDMKVGWRPHSVESPAYLHITENGNMEMVDGKLNNDKMIFWENLRNQYINNEKDEPEK